MAESLELQNMLAVLLANVQKISEENRANKEEAIKQNRSLHDENKKIFTAVHEQAKQNKQF